MRFRSEQKFLCSQKQLEILKHRVSCCMKLDPHYSHQPSYRIRSLYFDDYDNGALQEKEDGINDRRKFRIRVYDNPRERISLEIKHKIQDQTFKESCRLSEDLCRKLIDGGNLPYDPTFEKQMKLLYVKWQTAFMRPAIIIEYERTAYVHPHGNVRVTFDRNNSFSEDIGGFLNDRIQLKPYLPAGQHILEVKFDEFLPDYIAQLLEGVDLQRISFSKYYLGRVGLYNTVHHYVRNLIHHVG